MGRQVKFCKKCFEDQESYMNNIIETTGFTVDEFKKYFTIGYFTPNDTENKVFCTYHINELLNTSVLSIEEFEVISSISTDLTFIQSMENLKETDPIEYQSKMTQFRKTKEDDNKVKCPKCKSTNIQMIQRKWSLLTGFMTNKVDRVCVNCRHKF